ncbi:putative P-loop containing nucleoside triphosphate hydrolase, alpha/Beta hydrolase [Lupinus albus]|uniref:Putative P-loop containing nucleoside triphosphate hydrolase, alpha/Beta hydrolase n=1 Tax=Lupinus albus TaxID=3870 RepID=A0A6A4PH28_LUPAL|nr:putative P-loop containing nucleoside triphosphate hydrolase, alpha/Beta hydrolase [Lupinus albus]
MDFIQRRVEPWVRDQRSKLFNVSWAPLQWRMKWPWSKHSSEQKKKIQEEYQRRMKQLQDLCRALSIDSLSDLQDLLSCMVLSECVYKRPAAEMIRAVNKFKADFGGQIVALERVQPSSDHVPHRYLLAEAGDTLFASFIGTKQYKDIIADANILQGAIFHEDAVEESDGCAATESDQVENQNGKEYTWNPLETRFKRQKSKSKPAVHRGFMARAKGIPALELYRLAQKKKRKLVLCGHSLGGAVAALATLAILRVIAASSPTKENERVSIKCITFSQPPVGNAALKDYVNRKGWQHYFKSYCIPEDLVPRILSPAYFHHYSAQPQSMLSDNESNILLAHEQGVGKPKENDEEQLVLGVGPVHRSFWRLSRLVPLEGLLRQFSKHRERRMSSVETTSVPDSLASSLIGEEVVEPQSLEIQEGSDGISLKPLPDTEKHALEAVTNGKTDTKSNTMTENERTWRRVPYLPSYVPFGQLYLLGNSSVESLSGAEYSKLTSVKSVIAELRERFQSHSMRSYRSRFQRIYDLFMSNNASSFLGIEQWQQFPHLEQWLGLAAEGTVELGHIVESPVIRTATSIVPLGWNDGPGAKNREPLKVDITGFGLHLCTLVHAQVNGNWCSTTVESFPSAPNYSSNYGIQPELQNMRILVGAPLRSPPKYQTVLDSSIPTFTSVDSETASSSALVDKDKVIRPESLNNFLIFCTSDFTTVSREVHVRTRRVRLVGLQGAGKTTLLKAILNKYKPNIAINEVVVSDVDVQEGIADGLSYCDSAGINMQELNTETSRFRDELWRGIRDLSRKTDLIILVHNLSHSIPQYGDSNGSQQKPVLSLFLDEAKSLGIPWVLAITNKFSVSAHHQNAAIDAVLKAYQASPSSTGVINSCPYVMPVFTGTTQSWDSTNADSSYTRMGAQRILLAPINFVTRPFQKKEIILPVEGVNSLCQQIHRVLRSHEESSFQELARDRLMIELAREQAMSIDASRDAQAKAVSLNSAAVGASVGAGLGIVMAIVMGAASALRKP